MSEHSVSEEPFAKFSDVIRKHHFPVRSAYGWKDQKLFAYYQVGRIILVKESEVLAALEKFRRVGKPIPFFTEGKQPLPPKGPGLSKGSKNKEHHATSSERVQLKRRHREKSVAKAQAEEVLK
jgi:hypothetical protein